MNLPPFHALLKGLVLAIIPCTRRQVPCPAPTSKNQLAYSILRAAIENSPVPVWLVNEPMLISTEYPTPTPTKK